MMNFFAIGQTLITDTGLHLELNTEDAARECYADARSPGITAWTLNGKILTGAFKWQQVSSGDEES